MVDFVEPIEQALRTIQELLAEFVSLTFKRYFQTFLLKTYQQFV